MKGPQTNDRRSSLPRRTGHGDFPHPALASIGFSSKHSQRNQSQIIQVADGATGGVFQRLALPDYRVLRYRLRFFARA